MSENNKKTFTPKRIRIGEGPDAEEINKKINRNFFVVVIISIICFLMFLALFGTGATDERKPNADKSLEAGRGTRNYLEQSTRKCPVCSRIMTSEDIEFEHHLRETGEIFYFDSEECYRKFLNNPYQYSKKLEVEVKVIPKSPEETITPTPEATSGFTPEEPAHTEEPTYSEPFPRQTENYEIPAEELPDTTTPDAETFPEAQELPDEKQNEGNDTLRQAPPRPTPSIGIEVENIDVNRPMSQ